MIGTPVEAERGIQSKIEEIISDFSRLTISSIPRPPIYMDDFTPYGSDFQEALSNLGKVLHKCIEMNLSLNLENNS